MREEGAGALFKGLTPVMLRAFPANAVSFRLVKFSRLKAGSSPDAEHALTSALGNQDTVNTPAHIRK